MIVSDSRKGKVNGMRVGPGDQGRGQEGSKLTELDRAEVELVGPHSADRVRADAEVVAGCGGIEKR
jgi:hypothetical protein